MFFSFHYERDSWRAAQVRNSGITRGVEQAGFADAASWEAIKRGGDLAIRRWIDKELNGTSVTVVLIGAETCDRKYVQYEIQQSEARGNGILGIYIHEIRNSVGLTDVPGPNPLHWRYATYNWFAENGYLNLGSWIEAAAKAVGR